MAKDALPRTAKTPHVFFNLAPFPFSLVAVIVSGPGDEVSPDVLTAAFQKRSLEMLAFRECEGSVPVVADRFEWVSTPPGGLHKYVCICIDDRPRVLKNLPPTIRFENLYASELARDPRLSLNGSHDGRATSPSIEVCGITRTTHDAWHIARHFFGGEHYSQLRDRVLHIVEERIPPFPVIRHMGGSGYASRTDLVAYKGQYAVCKTFRKNAVNRFNSELEGLGMSERFSFIPRLLEVGRNWLVMEYYHGYKKLKTGRFGLLELDTVNAAFGALRCLHEADYSTLDFAPYNVLAGPRGDVKLIDFEHLFRYTLLKPDFFRSPAMIGAEFFRSEGQIYLKNGGATPKWFDANLPNYDRHWRDRTGLPPTCLFDVPRSTQRFFRLRHVLFKRSLNYVHKIGYRPRSVGPRL